jgi:hypothetical protein
MKSVSVAHSTCCDLAGVRLAAAVGGAFAAHLAQSENNITNNDDRRLEIIANGRAPHHFTVV